MSLPESFLFILYLGRLSLRSKPLSPCPFLTKEKEKEKEERRKRE
jgi:hypothetical protein